MHLSRTKIPKRPKSKWDLKRGNGGRYKPTIHEVGYKEHQRGGGYCIYIKGLCGWNPAGNGYPITEEEEAIKLGKSIAKEYKTEWIGKL